jgi:RNA polymerase sigma-70 factor, ECF subfamily
MDSKVAISSRNQPELQQNQDILRGKERVSEPKAFLMTTTTRIRLHMLTSARSRREEYVGPWLPDRVGDTEMLAPASRTQLAEDVSIALLLILDQSLPPERAAFLLHEVLDFSCGEVTGALDRSEAACRQLATRARAHVREARAGGVVPRARSNGVDPKHAQLTPIITRKWAESRPFPARAPACSPRPLTAFTWQ